MAQSKAALIPHAPEAARLRGYCRVCNRYYFYRNQMNTAVVQIKQHHSGICQSCGYDCARIAGRAKKPA